MKILFFTFLALIIFYWFYSKKKLVKKMNTHVIVIKTQIRESLREKFLERYDKEEAMLLANSVVYEIFGEEPPDLKSKNFLKNNQERIDNVLLKMKDDEDLCRIITQTHRVNCATAHSLRKKTDPQPEIWASYEKLKKFDIWKNDLASVTPQEYYTNVKNYIRKMSTKV